FHRPQGGLFVWGLLPEGVDMPGFCRLAVQKKVAIVPGSAFMVDENERTQAVRLNFSTPSDENIVKGVSLLAEAAAETRAAL
nr:PLP-dependent aminotransferase family protein [Clostridiales bacterium]